MFLQRHVSAGFELARQETSCSDIQRSRSRQDEYGEHFSESVVWEHACYTHRGELNSGAFHASIRTSTNNVSRRGGP